MIKKTKDSTYYNKDAVTYKCLSCGDEYYTKYKDNDNKCMWCAIREERKKLR